MINGATVDRAVSPNSWCGACHNESADWLGAAKNGYATLLLQPARNASGYPVLGTYPGPSVYSGSAHAKIQAGPVGGPQRAVGDCLWCHASHRGPNAYDGLIADYRPSADLTQAQLDASTGQYARVCLDCHNGTVPGAADIQQHLSGQRGDGHMVLTAGGTLPTGSPVPCYECHNPHGSTLGNTAMVSDALGGNLNPRGDALQVRQFCFTCHTTADQVPKGWDSDLNNDGTHDDGGYVEVFGQTAVGLSRATDLTVPSVYGVHYADSTQNCNTCHVSVHAPVTNGQLDPQNCYQCHTSYRLMEHSSSAGGFLSRHVLGTSGPTAGYPAAGDAAFSPTTYPGATADGSTDTPVYCLSCHVRHDQFMGGTLRTSGTAGTQTATMADFVPDTGGVCIGCHSVERVKDADHADAGSTMPAVTTGAYAGSAHDYTVQGGNLGAPAMRQGFKRQGMQANCSKCHNDTQPREFQDLPGFGLHLSPYDWLLAAFSRPTPGAVDQGEVACYSCHSLPSDGFKSALNTDWYGLGANMSAASQAIYGQLQQPYGHRVGQWSGEHRSTATDEVSGNRLATPQHVECTDCHNSHAAGKVAVSGPKRSAATPASNAIGPDSPLAGVWGVEPPTASMWTAPNVTGYTVLSAAVKEYQVCFKCHSGFNATPIGTDQAKEFNTNNASYHPVMGPTRSPHLDPASMKEPWKNVGAQTMYCSDCHMASGAAQASGSHGSEYPYALQGYWNGGNNRLATETNDSDLLCNNCHLWRDKWPHTYPHDRNADSWTCANCHVAVPHGSNQARLVNLSMYESPYNWDSRLDYIYDVPPRHSWSSCSTGCH